MTSSLLSAYVSGYTSGEGKGIYLYDFDTSSGHLSPRGLVAEAKDPSFIVMHPSGQYLYVTNEVDEYNGIPSGYVSSYACNKEDGSLTLINEQPSCGENPCHAVLDASSRHLLVANYMGGNIASFPIILTDNCFGEIGSPVSIKSHCTLGYKATHANPSRQEKPHAHSIDLDPATQTWAFSMDLGCDLAIVYKFDKITGLLEPHSTFKFEDGTGPRHIKFAPNNDGLCYVVGELSNIIYMLEFNIHEGKFYQVQRIPMLPKDFKGESIGAEIDITSNGKFLYASTRGGDILAIYLIDELSGKLIFVDHQSTGGKHPRHFVIDPTGNYLLVGNKDSHNIVVFKINMEDGSLKLIQTISHPDPTCIQFRP
ncbi:Lactonase, 7-bladed beta-propeller-domain-containing protein [Phycomyces nitens]|nr:Lactonase, 7-bladed beta-propeller-domain-containing protein [Phycomyces nitens]